MHSAQTRPNQIWADFDCIWPAVARIGKHRPKLAEIGKTIGQTRANLARFSLKLAKCLIRPMCPGDVPAGVLATAPLVSRLVCRRRFPSVVSRPVRGVRAGVPAAPTLCPCAQDLLRREVTRAAREVGYEVTSIIFDTQADRARREELADYYLRRKSSIREYLAKRGDL